MSKEIETNLLRSLGNSYFTGPLYFGQALEQTGQVQFFHQSSALATTFEAGNATAALTYVFPTAGPAANNYLLASSTTGTLSWFNAAGTYAPIGSAFVTIGNDATLTAERALTGTANQITVTDGGANGNVTLSTPQNIHSGASPTFAGMTLTAFSGALSAAAGVLSAGTLSVANGGTGVTSLSDILGTANQISVAGGAARVIGGNVTLSTPQNIHTAATPTFAGLTLTGFSGAVSASVGVLSAGTLSVANGGTGVTSLSNIVGTANQITVTDGTARVIGANVTLSLPQDIASGSSPTFAGLTLNGNLTMGDGNNIVLNTTTGTKIGTATTQKLGFFNSAPVVQQASAANLTNNVTAGGTTDQIDNFTDLTTYSNDAATIRNDIYQLARKLKQVNDALRLYGLLS